MKSNKVYLLVVVLLLSVKLFAQVNPSLNYYPLHVGDVWQYKITYTPPDYKYQTFYMLKRVIADTILTNGKKYFLVEQPPFIWEEIKNLERVFIRIDSTTGVVYKTDSSSAAEEKIDSLFCKQGDRINSVYGTTICWGVSNEIVLGETRQVTTIGSPTTTNGNDRTIRRAFGIGVYNQSNTMAIVAITGNGYELVYAKINSVEYGQLVDVKGKTNFLPQEFSLSQNFPNPFNPTTRIQYLLPTTSIVSLKVYDLLGREIQTLINNETSPGKYEITFDGSKLASGVYFYRLQAGSFVAARKMIYLK